MRQSIKQKRAAEKLAKLLGLDQASLHQSIEEAPKNPIKLQLQGEAVLLSLMSPEKMESRLCKRAECGEYYMTNYRSQAYCSLNCTKKELAKYGIAFDVNKPEWERWGGEPPLTVSPAAINAMRRILQRDIHVSPTQLQDGVQPHPIVPVEQHVAVDEQLPDPVSPPEVAPTIHPDEPFVLEFPGSFSLD